jgi:hypothetical protein
MAKTIQQDKSHFYVTRYNRLPRNDALFSCNLSSSEILQNSLMLLEALVHKYSLSFVCHWLKFKFDSIGLD